MIEIDVEPSDPTLRFHFSDGWLAVLWDGAPEERDRRKPGRKCVDLVAAADVALLIEVKDDRNKTPASRLSRQHAVSKESFFDEMAGKATDSVRDILDVVSGPSCRNVFKRFEARWHKGRRQFLLWWELPPIPPSGPGTPDARWKVAMSAHRNKLSQRLRELNVGVHVANGRFGSGAIPGMTVSDVSTGIGKRRAAVRSQMRRKS